MRGDKDIRTCFVIMPFRIKKDLARKDEIDFDKVYREIIKPSVEGLKDRGIRINCVRSDEIELAGLIHERMIAHIAEADVAVVDITTDNPNVFYELGIRHALRDRVTVLMRRKGKPNPFNVGGMTTIEYDLDEQSAARARDVIANFVANGLLSGAKDSLVYTVLPGLRASLDPKAITESEVEEYEIPGVPGKRIGIAKGNLRHVNLGATLRERPIDIWVNSENVNMEMARPYDRSVSALIRYLGARKDDTGAIVEDLINDELRAKMQGRQLVNPGEVVSTGAGSLERTHHVKRIYHAASVYGVVGEGYNGIANVEQCITNALARVDWEALGLVKTQDKAKAATGKRAADSILFPLLSAGTARADVIRSARRQVATAISYLRSRAQFTHVARVYFLAGDETVLAALRVALAELGVISPKAPRKKANSPVKPVKVTMAERAKRKRTTRRARA
jgi:O-acetyl-ADP-ribose deacetylase (regulator of RNase III)